MHEGHIRVMSRRYVPSLSLLLAFEAVCRHGSTVAAARELSLTQGAVSRLVQNLEAQQQVQLFRRERKRLIPTDAAIAYARDVRKAVDLITRSSLRLRANPDGGTLSLAILPTFGTRWLAPRLPQFLATCPGVTINLGTRLDWFDFKQEAFDAAIHFGEEADWPEAEHLKLFDERLLACCAPSLREQHAITSPADMLSLTLLHLESRPTAWASWLSHHDCQALPVKGMVFDQFATMLQAAICGMGVALLPEFLATTEINEGRLVAAFGTPASGSGSYYLVWPGAQVPCGPLKAFRDWLEGATASLRTHGEL